MVQWRRAYKRFLAVWRSNNAFELIDDVALRSAQLVAAFGPVMLILVLVLKDSLRAKFKDHRQRIPKNCYKMIFRKINTEEIFFQLTLITNKDYFSRKKLFCENLPSWYM